MKFDVCDMVAGYGKRVVLNGISISIPAGSMVTLLGANGCGKSTLLKVMGRLLSPRSGMVQLNDRNIHRMPTGELAQVLAILPQMPHAPGEITVEELVGFGRFPRRKNSQAGLNAEDRAAVERALKLTRLESLRHRLLPDLSGGERQRAWIAMTLAQEPEVLLLDEPTTFLDICCQFEIIELVRRLNRECGITVVMVLHDLNLAARYSDMLVALKDHRVRYAGTPAEILKPDILREIFGIESEIILNGDGVPYFIPTGSAYLNGEQK